MGGGGGWSCTLRGGGSRARRPGFGPKCQLIFLAGSALKIARFLGASVSPGGGGHAPGGWIGGQPPKGFKNIFCIFAHAHSFSFPQNEHFCAFFFLHICSFFSSAHFVCRQKAFGAKRCQYYFIYRQKEPKAVFFFAFWHDFFRDSPSFGSFFFSFFL